MAEIDFKIRRRFIDFVSLAGLNGDFSQIAHRLVVDRNVGVSGRLNMAGCLSGIKIKLVINFQASQ